MSRPRILLVSYAFPRGESFGGQLRTLQMARLLRRCGEISVFMVLLGEPDPVSIAETRSEFDLKGVVQVEPDPIRGFRARVRRELDPTYLNTHGWRLAPAHVSQIRKLAGEADVTWFYEVMIPNSIGISRWPGSVLDVDNVPSHVLWSEVRSARSWRTRFLTMRKIWLWRLREARFLNRFDVLTVSSDSDARHFRGGERVQVIPNGFHLPEAAPIRNPVQPARIGFIGTLTYSPNEEGVDWFLRSVWPRIKAEEPSVRLRLVGKETDGSIASRGSDVDGLGFVPDPTSEIAGWSLMIVPIRAGGGTRIKIAEGFGRLCPVVSTRLGAFGYDVRSGDEILLADRPEDFARACLSILRDPRLGERLAARAREKFLRYWTWDALAPRVRGAVESCLRHSKSGKENDPWSTN